MQTFQIIVGRAGFEPAKVKPTDLQSVLVGRLSIFPKPAQIYYCSAIIPIKISVLFLQLILKC